MKDSNENPIEQSKEIEKSSKEVPEVAKKPTSDGEASPKPSKSPNKNNEKPKEEPKSNKFQLDPSEILPIEENFQPKMSNLSHAHHFLLNKLNQTTGIDTIITNGVQSAIKTASNNIKEKINSNSILFSTQTKTVTEIIQQKENKAVNFDEVLRQQKIKEFQDNKESIGNKIKTLEEHMKLLEIDAGINLSKMDLNMSLKGDAKELIDDNIRRSRIKEIKQTKELLEKKLISLDDHVQRLMTEEELNNLNKKFNLKQFLDNFEKDKTEAAQRAKKWELEQKERMRHLLEVEEKAKQKLKKKEEESLMQIKQKEKEREDAYFRKLDKRKQKDKVIHENLEKIKEEWKNKTIIQQEYRFQKYEKEFREQQAKENEERKNEEILKLQERKNHLKPINREEINEFSKKHMEERQKKILEKEKERLTKLEEIHSKNENMPKNETVAYLKAVEEAKQHKELIEKEKLDKIYKKMKIKQFSKVIKTELLPKIDEKKKKELEERIQDLKTGPKVKHLKKATSNRGRIILKKPDPNKPNKYTWKLKLNTSEDSVRGASKNNQKSRSKSARSFSQSKINEVKDNYEDDQFETEVRRKLSKSRSGEKRKPLAKKPDYLTEMRNKKINNDETKDKEKEKEKRSEKKWEKMLNNGKYSLIENVEQIKIKANMLEEQAKMKEKFLQLNGGAEKNPELGENVSNMLIDAIKAKLTILESISKKK